MRLREFVRTLDADLQEYRKLRNRMSRSEPAPGDLLCQALPAHRGIVPRHGAGRHPRSHSRRGEIRSGQRGQVRHLRGLVDLAADRPRRGHPRRAHPDPRPLEPAAPQGRPRDATPPDGERRRSQSRSSGRGQRRRYRAPRDHDPELPMPVESTRRFSDDDDRTLEELLASDSDDPERDAADAVDLSEQLEAALSQLPAREADILRLRFGTSDNQSLTLEEVGRRLWRQPRAHPATRSARPQATPAHLRRSGLARLRRLTADPSCPAAEFGSLQWSGFGGGAPVDLPPTPPTPDAAHQRSACVDCPMPVLVRHSLAIVDGRYASHSSEGKGPPEMREDPHRINRRVAAHHQRRTRRRPRVEERRRQDPLRHRLGAESQPGYVQP